MWQVKTKKIFKIVSVYIRSSKVDILFDLKFRWDNEKKYENFKDYADVLSKNIPNEAEFIKATKRPFGMIIKIDNINVHIFLKIKGNHICCCSKFV